MTIDISDYLTEECLQNEKIEKEYPLDDVEQQKKAAIKIIQDLKQKWPYTLLGGGAPRDWEHKRKAKDLDFFIFINSPIISLETSLEEILLQKVVSIRNLKKNDIPDMGSILGNYAFSQRNQTDLENLKRHRIIKTIYNAELYENMCQFIFIDNKELKIKSIEDYVEILSLTFDIGLCMIFFDDKKIYKTKHFVYDYKNEKLSIYINNIKTFAKFLYTLKHISRIAKKYPEYQINFVGNPKQIRYLNEMFANYYDLYEERFEAETELGEKDEFETHSYLQ